MYRNTWPHFRIKTDVSLCVSSNELRRADFHWSRTAKSLETHNYKIKKKDTSSEMESTQLTQTLTFAQTPSLAGTAPSVTGAGEADESSAADEPSGVASTGDGGGATAADNEEDDENVDIEADAPRTRPHFVVPGIGLYPASMGFILIFDDTDDVLVIFPLAQMPCKYLIKVRTKYEANPRLCASYTCI
jgi:hypothetical protein